MQTLIDSIKEAESEFELNDGKKSKDNNSIKNIFNINNEEENSENDSDERVKK